MSTSHDKPIEVSDSTLELWIQHAKDMRYYELVAALKELKYRRDKGGKLL